MPDNDTLSIKQSIRDSLLKKRKSLTSQERQTAGEKAAAFLIQTNFYKNSQMIACYLAIGGEIETQPIIQQIRKDQKQCYIPILNPYHTGTLLFGLYLPETQLIKNKCRTLEPTINPKHLISPNLLDLVILPLTAFDHHGNRLGMGGGYYDRTFAFLKQAPSNLNHRPFLCGLAYDFQETPEIPSETWDVQLDAVITDKGLK